jgi:hypothetical protein
VYKRQFISFGMKKVHKISIEYSVINSYQKINLKSFIFMVINMLKYLTR